MANSLQVKMLRTSNHDVTDGHKRGQTESGIHPNTPLATPLSMLPGKNRVALL